MAESLTLTECGNIILPECDKLAELKTRIKHQLKPGDLREKSKTKFRSRAATELNPTRKTPHPKLDPLDPTPEAQIRTKTTALN